MKSVTLTNLAKRGFQIFAELGFAFKNYKFRGHNYIVVYEHNGNIEQYCRASVTPNLELEVETK